jgi:hypothetical protein
MTKIIIANLISMISLVCLVVFGVTFLQFKNTPIYQDYKIEITNNPITGDEHIEFAMIGKKNLDCQADHVYGVAYNDKDQEVILDQFATMYTRNVSPGKFVTNSWSFVRPSDLTSGIWRVDMVGEWTCRYFVFTNYETIRNHDNILLIVE